MYFRRYDLSGENSVDKTVYTVVAEKTTNYNMLFFKTPEELANLLSRECPPDTEISARCENGAINGNCVGCWLDWLNREVKDEKEKSTVSSGNTG